MKKVRRCLAALLALIGLLGLGMTAQAQEGKVYWADILDALSKHGAFQSAETTARLEKGKITVSGGTVYDVMIRGNLPRDTRTVEFHGVVLKSDASMEIDAQKGETLKIVFDKNTVEQAEETLEKSVCATAKSGGKLEIIMEGSGDGIYIVTEEGGECKYTLRGRLDNQILAHGSGRMEIVNDGYTHRGIAVNTEKKGTANVRNHKNVDMGVQMHAIDDSYVFVENHQNATIKSVYIEAWGGGRGEMLNHGKIKHLVGEAYDYGEAVLVNHGVVLNEGFDEDYLHLIADETGKMTFSGSGVIKPGYTIYDYGDGTGETEHERTATEPIYIEFWLGKQYEDVREARAAVVDAYRRGFEFPLENIQVETDVNQVVVVVYYTKTNGEEDSFYIRQAEFYSQETGGLYEGEGALKDLPPVEMPTLVLPSGENINTDPFLKYEEPNVNKHNTIVYNVHLVDRDGVVMELPEESTLCFPYPEGLDENNARRYKIVIHHYGSKETEIFSTEKGNIELTKQGLCIRVSSFSPFEMAWETDMDAFDVPRTGDTSCPALWLLLLFAAGGAMTLLRRKQSA